MARKSTDLLARDLDEVIDRYVGKLSFAEALGALVLKVVELATHAQAEDEDDEEEDVRG